MITSKEINRLIRESIKKFGEYSYYDKGAGEVMDLDAILLMCSDMSAEQVADVLAKVREINRHGEHFITGILHRFDDDSKMDSLFKDTRICDLY